MPGSKPKKKKRKRDRMLTAFKTQLKKEGLLQGRTLQINPSGQEKMSDVLMEFLEPYEQYIHGHEDMQKLIPIGIMAWNAALVDAQKRRQMVNDLLSAAPPDIRADMQSILDEMIRRKQQHFAHNRRTILEYKLTQTPRGPHLAVISSLPNPDKVEEP